jgi:hypothetical protein
MIHQSLAKLKRLSSGCIALCLGGKKNRSSDRFFLWAKGGLGKVSPFLYPLLREKNKKRGGVPKMKMVAPK